MTIKYRFTCNVFQYVWIYSPDRMSNHFPFEDLQKPLCIACRMHLAFKKTLGVPALDHSAHFDVKISSIGLCLTEFHSLRDPSFLSQTFGIISHKNCQMQKTILDLGSSKHPESVDINLIRQKLHLKKLREILSGTLSWC